MEKADLPTETALEPNENANLPDEVAREMPPFVKPNLSKKLTFVDDTEFNEKSSSQRSISYKEVLSQPDTGLSHRQRLQWLQKRRTAGLWVQCDKCDRWRYMSGVLDRHELPMKWYCTMNPDVAFASCSASEAALRVCEEEDLIHGEFACGSLVWARLAGWPRWPAMVDDCPDAEQYYWLDGFSDIPTHYNVVFFDSQEVSRAWIDPSQLQPYSSYTASIKHLSKNKGIQQRLKVAIEQADDASTLPLDARLAKYSFISRHKGHINSPKHISKTELEKYQRKFRNKYNIDVPMQSSEDDAELSREVEDKVGKRKNREAGDKGEKRKNRKIEDKVGKRKNREIEDKGGKPKNSETELQVAKRKNEEVEEKTGKRKNCGVEDKAEKRNNREAEDKAGKRKNGEVENKPEKIRNVIFLGTPKSVKKGESRVARKLEEDINMVSKEQNEVGEISEVEAQDSEAMKPPNSLAAQAGSTFDTGITNSFDNDTSEDYVPPNGVDKHAATNTGDFTIRIESPNSDDFDF